MNRVLYPLILLTTLSIATSRAEPDPDAPPVETLQKRPWPHGPIDLPLHTAGAAKNYFLSRNAVRSEVRSRKGKWWTQVVRNPDRDDEWVLVLGNGDGLCRSSHQCSMRVRDDGTITYALRCSDGWNCK